MTDTYDLSTDIVDRIAGLTPGSPAHATRHKRDKVAAATQRSYRRGSPTPSRPFMLERPAHERGLRR